MGDFSRYSELSWSPRSFAVDIILGESSGNNDKTTETCKKP
jgi:hypothetical protein